MKKGQLMYMSSSKMMSRNRFSHRLARVMQSLNLNRSEVSKLVGISTTAVDRHLTSRAIPRVETMRMYSKALNIPVEWLCGHGDDNLFPVNEEVSTSAIKRYGPRNKIR